MTDIILGSTSPRRKEILKYFHLPFQQISPQFDEDSIPFNNLQPSEYVCQLSKGKADSLASAYPKAAILTADTIVYCQNKLYGKPRDKQEAFQMLSELSGNWHSVFTGVTLRKGNQEFHQAEETRVLLNPLTPSQIRTYHEALHCYDKAGGYAIQKEGGLIICKIEGCFNNVMGLPINTVQNLFLRIGLDFWQYLLPPRE